MSNCHFVNHFINLYEGKIQKHHTYGINTTRVEKFIFKYTNDGLNYHFFFIASSIASIFCLVAFVLISRFIASKHLRHKQSGYVRRI